MTAVTELWTALADFVALGGVVLVVILLVTFVMWTLIVERWRYLGRGFAADADEAIRTWEARADRSSWHAHQVRRELVSRCTQRLRGSIPFIKALITVCPLLGILGTVTGMIEVFAAMGGAGSASPRILAGGVSRATIPTMAGMVAALSGLVVSVQLERRAGAEASRLADRLTPET